MLELSIVIVIIGIIVAGVTAGQALVKQAKLRSGVSEYNTFSQAFAAFKLQYNSLPGDLSNASSYWGSAHNGDGNKKIEDRYPTVGYPGTNFEYRGENMYMWEHLGSGRAKLLPGNYNGRDIYLSGFGGGTVQSELPASSFGSYWGVAYDYNRNKNYFVTGATTPSISIDYTTNNILRPKDAIYVDSKIDDGMPYSGRVIATSLAGNYPINNPTYSNVSSNNVCTTGTAGSVDKAAVYNISNSNVSCSLIMEVN